jgi:hypothetical protein
MSVIHNLRGMLPRTEERGVLLQTAAVGCYPYVFSAAVTKELDRLSCQISTED